MKFRKSLLGAGLALALTGTAPAQSADIIIGVPPQPSGLATAHVLKTAIEESLGFDVELQLSTNAPIFEAMDSGAMHVHAEVWLPNQDNLANKFVHQNKTVRIAPNGVAGDQYMCVSKDTAERTGIEHLSDLTNPDIAAHFDTNGDGKGEVWIGVKGWASTNVEKIRAKSYGYSETMELKVMDETLALAEVDAAVAKKENIVFFCYTPHHMFTLYDLVILKEPPYDEAKWKVIQPTDDPEWLEKSNAAVAWDTAYLHVFYAAALEKSHPTAAKMLHNVKFNTDQISSMTYALVVEKQDPAAFAKKWVSENGSVVDEWLK